MAVNGRDLEQERPEDARLAAIYRSAAVEEPPERLDALLRDEARRPFEATVPRRPKVRWWHAWRVPLAFASVAMLSVSVVLIAQREGGEPLTMQGPREAPAPAAPRAEPPAAPSSNDSLAPATPSAADRASPRLPAAGDRAGAEGTLTARAKKQAADAASEPPAELERRKGQAEASRPEAFPGAAPGGSATPAAPATIGPSGLSSKPEAFPGASAPAGVERRESIPLRSLERVEPQLAPPPAEPPARYEAPPPPKPAPAPAAKPASPRPALKSFAPAPEVEDRMPAAKPMVQSPSEASPGSGAAPAAKRDSMQQAAGLASLMSELEGRPPRQWLDRIAALRAQGRREDADDLLREFKRRFPYEPLPPEVQ